MRRIAKTYIYVFSSNIDYICRKVITVGQVDQFMILWEHWELTKNLICIYLPRGNWKRKLTFHVQTNCCCSCVLLRKTNQLSQVEKYWIGNKSSSVKFIIEVKLKLFYEIKVKLQYHKMKSFYNRETRSFVATNQKICV